MTVTLEEPYASLVEAQVRTGRYESAADVVIAGLGRLEDEKWFDSLDREWLRREIEKGFRESEVGPLTDGDAFFEQLRSEAD